MLFGKKGEEPAERPPANPKVRSNIYALAALYLLYLFYKIAKPYLTKDPYDSPSTQVFLLGTVVLLGGAAALGLLSWKMAHVPMPEPLEEPEESEELEEQDALPEEDEDDGEETP